MSLNSLCGGWLRLVLLLSRPPGHNSVGQGVALVAVVGVGPLGTGVAVVWLEGDHGCLGGVLLGHDVGGAEGGLVSIVLVWVLVEDVLMFCGGCGLMCSFCGPWIGLC